MSAIATAEDLSDLASDVLDWLEGDGQSVFNIAEYYAGYPTEVCSERIEMAAESLSNAIDLGRIPADCPPVNRAIMAEVYRQLADGERARIDAAAAWEASKADRAREVAESVERAKRAAELRIRDQRRAETYRALLRPDSGASASERAQAAQHLASL
jgi:hypothetical protein